MNKVIVQKLEEEIKNKNRKDIIESYEEILSEDIKDLSRNEHFFYNFKS